MLQPPPVVTKVVCLTQVVTVDELKDDDEYEDILEDIRMEAGKFGKIFQLAIYFVSSLSTVNLPS
jgi:splicing factor U2AF subunit